MHQSGRYFAYALMVMLVGAALAALPVVQTSHASHENITVEVDSIEFGAGDDVVITGTIDDVSDEETVSIRVTKAAGGSDTEEADVENNGDFELVYELANNAADGIYVVRVTYDGENAYSYFLVNEEDDPVIVALDEETYEAGSDVEITGEVDDVENDVDEVEITILDPSNDELLDDEEGLDGDEFEHTFELDSDAPHGRYAVTVTYNNADSGYAIFEVEEDGGSSNDPITASVSKATYTPESAVRVTGEVEDVVDNEDVEVVILNPEDDEVFEDNVEPENDGSFEFEYELPDDAEEGTYTVTLSYDGEELELSFKVSDSTTGSGGSSSDLAIKLDKTSYRAGESMTVSGKVPKMVNDAVVNIDVFDPEGIFAGIFTTTEPASDLTYSATVKLKSDLEVDEDYRVKVNYGTYEGEAEFSITGVSNPGAGTLTIRTDDSEYEVGSSVRITGTIGSDLFADGEKVLIRVNKPDGNPYRIDIVEPSSTGSYTYDVVIGGELAVAGEYEVVATYDGTEAATQFDLVGPQGKKAYNLKVDDKTYPIEYEVMGGEIKSMFIRADDNMLVLSIDATEDGQLILSLPRNIIDAVENGTDKQYVVATTDLEAGIGNNVDIEESETTDEMRTIVIDYKAGTDLIEISGTSVVPEFGAVSAIILAVAIVGMVVATARFQKQSFFK